MTLQTVRSTRRARPAAAALAATVAVLLAGCGSATSADDAEGGAASSSSPSPSEPASSPTEDQGPGAGANPDDTPVPVPGEGEAVALPACSEVWVAGATLPRRYTGCAEEAGASQAADRVLTCESGQRLASYGETFWAVSGKPVREVASVSDDSGFRDAMASCTA